MATKDTLVPRPTKTRVPQLVQKHEKAILTDWLARQSASTSMRADLLSESELREQSTQFLAAFREGLLSGEVEDTDGAAWEDARAVLDTTSRSRALAGFAPSETAMFVFSLKEPLFALLRREMDDPAALLEELWLVTLVLDKLGLFTHDAYLKARESVITRQQQELLELSTPVVTLWQGVLALPLIGTLDSARTQVVMESLLERLAKDGADTAIIDITGVPTVDTLVAQHLLKTVAAARLMGADCIISGIRPQIAQTIVHLGIALGSVVTKATLADAFAIALQRTGRRVVNMPRAEIAGASSNGTFATERAPSQNGI